MSTDPRYPLASTTWDAREREAVLRVLDSGRFTMGSEVGEFERSFAEYIGTKYAVMVNSGSSANLAIFAALRYHSRWAFPEGGELIVPAVSWGTTYYPASQHDLTLRFVDVCAADWNLDPAQVRDAINERTVGVFAVNLLGAPAPLGELRRLCEETGILLLEDNCESLGARLDGQMAGSFGLAGSHSSFFSHHICTMEGGLVTTDDDELYELLQSVRAHGWLRGLPIENLVHARTGDPFVDSFTFALPGYNLRPLEMEGAIGSEQLLKLPVMVEQRRRNARAFLEAVAELPWLRPQRPTGESSWFGFGMVLDPDAPITRADLTARLADAGIECRPIVAGNFTRNPVMRHLRHAPVGPLPIADELHERGLFVGNHHFQIDDELQYLRETLSEAVAS